MLTKHQQTFSTFFVGKSNEYAHDICTYVSKYPAKEINPLFIAGPTGTGKTHLLRAIAHALKEHPSFKVLHLNNQRLLPKSIAGYNALFFDDIHKLKNLHFTQSKLHQALDGFVKNGKQVVITGNAFLEYKKGFHPELLQFLKASFIVPILPPDLETRMKASEYFKTLHDIPITKEVMHYLAQNSKNSFAELQQNMLSAKLSIDLGVDIDIPSLKRKKKYHLMFRKYLSLS